MSSNYIFCHVIICAFNIRIMIKASLNTRNASLWQICMRRQSVKCLHCPTLISQDLLYVCPLHQVLFNNVAVETCSLRMWLWQMSNYRSDIHVSHLWPAWPAISPTDAECEMRELSLSTQAPGKAARPILACHPSLVPLGCRSCVTVPLSQTADPTEDAPAGWSNISLG